MLGPAWVLALDPCSRGAQAESSDPACRLRASLTPWKGPRLKLWTQHQDCLAVPTSRDSGSEMDLDPCACLQCLVFINCSMVLLNVY